LSSRFNLICSFEPDLNTARGTNGDQATKEAVPTLFSQNLVLDSVSLTGLDDLIDLIRTVYLELPAETFVVGRLIGRGTLEADDRFPMLNREEAGKLVSLINPSEPEQLIEGALGVLVANIHNRVQLHFDMIASGCEAQATVDLG
jgi:hypothetical protein